MKKPHVLNRPMFTKGGISAYGRGITSNLVTEEQRQRFNYGGRVGLRVGGGKRLNQYKIMEGNKIPLSYLNQSQSESMLPPLKVKDWWQMDESIDGVPTLMDLQEEEYYGPLGNYKPYVVGSGTRPGMKGKTVPILARGTGEKGDVWFGESGEEVQSYPDDVSRIGAATELAENRKAAKERALDVPIIDQNIRNDDNDNLPTDPASDTIDWEELLGPTEEQKKRTKGEAQLGLASGVLDVFSQPTIAKAMSRASPHLDKLAKTALEPQKAREKAILQGKILEKVYRARAEEKGKQDRLTKGDEDTLTDIENYIGVTTAWKNKTKEKKMSGETHQDLIGSFDEEVAKEAIVLNPKTTGIGDKAVTTMPENDQKKLDAAEEGDTIIIGEQIFIKDSSAPGGMRQVSYTELKKLRQGKKKKAKTYLDLAQGG